MPTDGAFHGGHADHRFPGCHAESGDRRPPRARRRNDLARPAVSFARSASTTAKPATIPQNLDDLKKGMPELHFLRYAAYKDPMKKDDGAWRFIYVNAAGQIIGSVKYATLQQMAIMDMNGGKIPGVKPGDQSDQPGVPASSLADQSNSNSGQTQAGPESAGQTNPQRSTASGTASNAAGTAASRITRRTPKQSAQNPASAAIRTRIRTSASPSPTSTAGTAGIGGVNTNLNNQSLAALAALKPTGPVDGPVLGGFLTGVGSSVDKPSIRIYNGGKKYSQWEFIWNPVEDQAKARAARAEQSAGALPGQPGQAIGSGAGGHKHFRQWRSASGPGAANSPNSGSVRRHPIRLQPGSDSAIELLNSKQFAG